MPPTGTDVTAALHKIIIARNAWVYFMTSHGLDFGNCGSYANGLAIQCQEASAYSGLLSALGQLPPNQRSLLAKYLLGDANNVDSARDDPWGNAAIATLATLGIAGPEEAAVSAAEDSGTALVPKATSSLGKWGEARLADALGGAGSNPSSPFVTSLGRRYVDRLVNGVAYEAKAGINVGLTSSIRTQALKDAELVATGQVRGAVWYFFQGAQQETLDYLSGLGIRTVVAP